MMTEEIASKSHYEKSSFDRCILFSTFYFLFGVGGEREDDD